MSWQPGRLLGHYLTAGNLRLLGRLFARLHIHGAAWDPPAGFSTRVFDAFLSRGEPNVLFADGQLDAYGNRELDLLRSLHGRVGQAYAALDRGDVRVIHCDLWHDNVKLHRGVLYPFDFEDTVWGFRLHDIAMAMLDLLEDTDGERYPPLLASFRQGYTELLDWPEGDMEILQIGRLLWSVNWVARFRRQHLRAAVERRLPLFERYLQTGKLS
jgi:Ser/Thr protein kinase RdoA (MazF antagonist)